MSAAFFDTNIVIHAAQSAASDKRDHARALLRSRNIVVSTQVLMEAYAVLRRKLGFSRDEARHWIATLSDEIVVPVEAADVNAALKSSDQFQIGHWDALILRAAEKAGIETVYSEDLNHGQRYGPVRVCNPFIEDFLASS